MLQELLSVGIPPLIEVQYPHLVQCERQFTALWAKRVVEDGQRPLEDRLGLLKLPFGGIDSCQVGESKAHLGMLLAECLFAN